jgi:hypothetical protein
MFCIYQSADKVCSDRYTLGVFANRSYGFQEAELGCNPGCMEFPTLVSLGSELRSSIFCQAAFDDAAFGLSALGLAHIRISGGTSLLDTLEDDLRKLWNRMISTSI